MAPVSLSVVVCLLSGALVSPARAALPNNHHETSAPFSVATSRSNA